MCVYIQEAIYDEDKLLKIVDNLQILDVVQKYLILSIDYQNIIDLLVLSPFVDELIAKEKVLSIELSTYRKAIQIMLPNGIKIVDN